MKPISSLVFLLFISAADISAQRINPYEQFGYQPKNNYVMTKYPEGMLLRNTDTTSDIQNLIISLRTREVFYLAGTDSVYKVVSVPAKDILRFLSVDPLTKNYPMLTPYQYASNRPIDGIDMDGLEYLPYHSSMYRMQYSVVTGETTMGDGTKITTANSQTVVNTVYGNIPSALQNAKTQSFKYVSGGPVTTMGRDYTPAELSGLMYDRSKYFASGPQFYGADGSRSFSGIQSLRGNAVQATQGMAQSIGGAGGALGPNGAGGMVQNWMNVPLWNALTEESKLREGFYNATQTASNFINSSADWKAAIPDEASRAAMVNFLTDGYLPTAITDRFTGSEFQQLRLSGYGQQLQTAWYGLQIMQQAGVEIREQTKSAVMELYKKYKAEGGTGYDGINQLLNPSQQDR